MSDSTTSASVSMRATSAYRISFSVTSRPCTWRSSPIRATHSSAVAGASPRTRRASRAMCAAQSASASAARRVRSWTVANSASTCSAVSRSSTSGPRRSPTSASPSQWKRSAARAQAATSVRYRSAVGSVSATCRAMDRHSAMPRTRSALPIRASGPAPAAEPAVYVSETYGVRQSCTGCTRAGSPGPSAAGEAGARSATRVPSSKSA